MLSKRESVLLFSFIVENLHNTVCLTPVAGFVALLSMQWVYIYSKSNPHLVAQLGHGHRLVVKEDSLPFLVNYFIYYLFVFLNRWRPSNIAQL